MYFDNWSDFFAMGGHGVYVWSAYGFALLIIIWNVLAPVLAHKKAITQVRRLERIKVQKQKQQPETASESRV